MNKIVLSVVLSLAVGGGLVAGVALLQRQSAAGTGQTCGSCERIASELTEVREEIRAMRAEQRALLRERGAEVASRPTEASAVADAGDVAGEAQAAAEIDGEGLKTLVLSAIQEDRKQREASRLEEREEAKQRAEAKRQEITAMMEGPYDRYNLKVSSLSKVLEMNDAQKQSYFELSKQAHDKLKEGRQQLATAKEAGTAEESRPRGKEGASKARELQESVQKEFQAGVARILTAPQLETYEKLSRSARDFSSLGLVAAPGEDPGPFARIGGAGGGPPTGSRSRRAPEFGRR